MQQDKSHGIYCVINRVLDSLSDDAVAILFNTLPLNKDAAAKVFCDRFKLDSWFYEAMALNNVNIRSVVGKESTNRIASELASNISLGRPIT